MPGSNARALEKARTLACDCVALDLEDAVTPEAKTLARAQVCEAVKARPYGSRLVAVRINSLETQWGEADVSAVAEAGPDAVILPKTSTAGDIAQLHRLLPDGIAIWAMIETARGVLHLPYIAESGAACLILGSNDLLKEMRAPAMPERENLWPVLSAMVMHARAHGLAVIDGTFNDIADEAGFAKSCAQGHAFGFDGKSLVHPSQIETANRAFSPSPEQLTEARAIIAAFAKNPGQSVIALEGRMVERLHAVEAARLIALAEATSAR